VHYALYGRSTTAPVADDAPTTARDRFGGQKAISSDMFFERGSYDAATASEGRTRLAQFQGATSISSNQYFGREEEEALSQASDGGMLGDSSLAGLENAARDAVSRIITNPDVQNLGESIRSGALKVCYCLFVARMSPMSTLGFLLSSRIIWLRCQSASWDGKRWSLYMWAEPPTRDCPYLRYFYRPWKR
jgi:hypothetical protein